MHRLPSQFPGTTATARIMGGMVLLLALAAFCPPTAVRAASPSVQDVIVYSRVPRTLDTTMLINGEPVEVRHLDVFDALPEVAMPFSGFSAPGQLVLRGRYGWERVIFDCYTENLPCVPFDASVSLDGRRIAFAVYRADGFKQRRLRQNEVLPNKLLGSSGRESQIYIYTIQTGELSAWPHVPGRQDTSPVWLPDGRIMFASDRHGTREPFIPGATPTSKAPPRLYVANADGTGVVDIAPHEVGGAMHPWLLNSGRVAYSSKWLSHNLPFVGTNGGINWFTTLENMWVLADIDYRGGDMTALLGSHRNAINAADGRLKTMKALHFIGQRRNDDICIGNYYRRNNLGLGDVWCFTPEPKLLEGPVPSFLPSNIYNLANWSKSNDEANFTTDRAKVGFPEGARNGQLIVTVGKGWCTRVAYSRTKTPGKIDNAGQIGCDAGIYKTTTIPSKELSDLELIVDRPEWHEFNARIVKARNIPLTPVEDSGDGSCVIASSDAGSTDAHHYGKYQFSKMYKAMANNGGEIHGLSHDELAGIRFYELLPNGPRRVSNITGNDLRLLGDVPLLGDDSFVAKVPCDTPMLMTGVDEDGLIIKRDQIPMSLRPGERRVCTGCHLHGSPGRPFESSLAATAVPVPLPAVGQRLPTWNDDVQAIMNQRCVSCHDVFGDYEKLTYDTTQRHALVPVALREDKRRWRREGLFRPATSKYVNSMFARESMLYWVAAGQRTDGRSDEDYDDDLDYPADHPDVRLPPRELAILAAWLDGGYPEAYTDE